MSLLESLEVEIPKELLEEWQDEHLRASWLRGFQLDLALLDANLEAGLRVSGGAVEEVACLQIVG